MYYFVWFKEWPASLEETPHDKEEIFSFDFVEKEGDRPTAQVVIANPFVLKKGWQKFTHGGVIEISPTSPMPHIHFTGFITSFCGTENDSRLKIFLTGGKDKEGASAMNPGMRNLVHLFREENNPEAFLAQMEGRMMHWSRQTGDSSSYDPFAQKETKDITDQTLQEGFLYDTLTPLGKNVHLTLTTEWLQRFMGFTDISFTLRTLFPRGLVNTLTGEHLKKNWWKPSAKIGKSNYWIESSDLRPIPAPSTGVLNIYPSKLPYTLSPLDPLNASGQPKEIHIKRSWFIPRVLLGWIYRQKRREKVHYILDNPMGLETKDPVESIHVLRRSDHSADDHQKARGHFFTTGDGQQVRSIALKIQAFRLNLANRLGRLSINILWDAGIKVALGDLLIIQDPRLPHGEFQGKVTQIHGFLHENNNRAVGLTLLADPSAMVTWGQDTLKIHEPHPLEGGIDYPMALTEQDLIEHATLNNGPDAQRAALQEQTYPNRHNLTHILESLQTTIEVKLRDISASPVLERFFTNH